LVIRTCQQEQGKLDLFEKLVFAKNIILLINDNPYSFVLNDNPMSLLQVNGAKEVALELNSLSKTFNMAGWRVGMVLGNAKAIDAILKVKSNMDSGILEFRKEQLLR
jgi:aspartate/methionine/tyrosine aminotransferase